MDAMVTARMAQGKKEAGNEVLKLLGTNPSKVINELYDYVILYKQLPQVNAPASTRELSLDEALVFIDSIPITHTGNAIDLTDDQIRQGRLISRGLALPGDFM